MELKLNNLDKPSNKKLKRIADILLYLLPLYIPIIAVLDPISPEFSKWTIAGISVLVVTLKGLTKFTSEDESV